MKQKIIIFTSLAIIVSCFLLLPISKAETLQEKKTDLQEKREEAEKNLEYIEGELSEVLIRIQELDDKIIEAETQIAQMETQLVDLNTKVTETTKNLEAIKLKYNTNREIMEKRLVVMYECGDISYLDLLLHSSSLVEFLSNYYVIEEIVQSDNQILEEIVQEETEIETKKKQLEEEKAELKQLKSKQDQTKIIMQNNRTVQQSEINKLSDSEKELQDKISKYKAEEAKVEALIMLAANNYEYAGEYVGGVMLWPVAKSGTVITSGYGGREHPIEGVSKFHTGIDIGNAGFGAPIVAAADGVVTLASYYGGYGNCVMINHGNGISTLYGHGQKILTEVGKEVKKGELIMEVGSTGMSTGPHCHFEVRINGVHTNPLPYVQGIP